MWALPRPINSEVPPSICGNWGLHRNCLLASTPSLTKNATILTSWSSQARWRGVTLMLFLWQTWLLEFKPVFSNRWTVWMSSVLTANRRRFCTSASAVGSFIERRYSRRLSWCCLCNYCIDLLADIKMGTERVVGGHEHCQPERLQCRCLATMY